ncbi:MAG: hypothetical protein LBC61_03885 [Candidatus Peribacteria bacterium]|nr:hypothetical protein [Candidatus Peribacteria bacterium]
MKSQLYSSKIAFLSKITLLGMLANCLSNHTSKKYNLNAEVSSYTKSGNLSHL